MMQSKEMLNQIADCFNARGRFVESEDFVGMEASRTPELFIEFFNSLDSHDKYLAANTLIDGALGYQTTLQPLITEILQLIVYMCISNYGSFFIDKQEEIEGVFNDQNNLIAWAGSEGAGSAGCINILGLCEIKNIP